jgi:predicted acyl esterase
MRARLLLLALAFTAASLSGCLDGGRSGEPGPGAPVLDPPSAALYDLLPAEEVWVESSVDGKRMHNALYRPDTQEPVPVFINFSPYWGDTAETGGDAFAQYLIAEYVPRGFAVVLSAVRGTGHSEGCFQIGGDVELQDSRDVIDFFAAQPWSNGNVAAGGKSYDSTTQNGVIAKFPTPNLKGIFHVSGITDMYRYNYYGGVPYASGVIFNTYYYGQTIHEYGIPLPLGGGSPPSAGSPEGETPESLARLVDDVACTELPQMQLSGVGSGATGQKDAYWQERDWTRFIAGSNWTGSIFFVHGFQDWNVKPDHMIPWLTLLPDAVKTQTLGWLHQWQDGGDGHVYPMRPDWNQTMLAWMDHVLKGKTTGIAWGFELQSMGDEKAQVWTRVEAWPPQAELVTDEAELAFPDGLHLTGGPWAEVRATITDPQAVLSLRLEKTDGTWITEGVLRALYRDGLDEPTLATPGEPTTFRIDFYPVDIHLAPGEGLRVVAGEGPQYALATAPQLAGVAYNGITLHLPYSADSKPLNPQPTLIECFTC